MFVCIAVKRKDTKYMNNVTKKRSCLFLGGIENITYTNRGIVHRQDGPAVISYDKYGIAFMIWVKHGKKHNIGKPAFIQFYYENGKKRHIEIWYENGKLHRLDGPARIDRNFVINQDMLRYTGKLDRRSDYGPYWVSYNYDGTNRTEEWFKDDVLDRRDGPAVIVYNKDETVMSKKWFRNGKREFTLNDICIIM
jgi:hypothetical protein